MDATITYNEVASLLVTNIPPLEPHQNFDCIRVLCCHFKRALQHLPCPQSTQLRWKGLVISRAIYALLTIYAFCLPNDPEPTADYRRADPNNLTPLTHMEEASVNTTSAREKHYFLLLQNIKRVCFNTLDLSVNDPFKVSNEPTIQGWHMGMTTWMILDQLSTSYGQPTPAATELNNTTFCGQYSATNAPEVLFRCIENCTEIVIMSNNPYTNCQLINNAVHLLLMTGLY
jgi:hypothetical protein